MTETNEQRSEAMAHFPTPEHERLANEGMYRPEYEGDACGVGLVAATDGLPSRRVVSAAIEITKADSMAAVPSSQGRAALAARRQCVNPTSMKAKAVLSAIRPGKGLSVVGGAVGKNVSSPKPGAAVYSASPAVPSINSTAAG